MKPPISILSKEFRYTDSANTNIRLRFAQMTAQTKKDKPKPEPKTQGPIDIQRKRA